MRLTSRQVEDDGVPSFLRKKKEPKKNLFGEKLRFSEKGRGGGFWAMLRRIGLYEADPPMGCVERALWRVGVLCISRFLSDGEKARGVAHLKPSPGRGRGTTVGGG